MGIVIAIFIFSFIIFFHELGHFLAAKKQGIEVFEFSVGMGPVLFFKEYKGTKYCLKALPFGGSCMMGEDDGDGEGRGNFHQKTAFQRAIVIVAGAGFNFLLAFVLSVLLVSMTGYDSPVIGEVQDGYPAKEAGLRPGDEILQMGNRHIHLFREILIYNRLHQGEKVEVVYRRDGKKEAVSLMPKKSEDGVYRLGLVSGGQKKGGLFTSIRYGFYEVRFSIVNTIEGLKMLIARKIGIQEMSGPVGIVKVVDNTYQASKQYGVTVVIAQLLSITILISANLGVMNLLPLPALDGGRLVFLILEMIRGKKIPPEKEGYVHFVGIILLMALMVFVLFHDIYRLIR